MSELKNLQCSEKEIKFYQNILDKAERLGFKKDFSESDVTFNKWLHLAFLHIQNSVLNRLNDLKLSAESGGRFPSTLKSVIGDRTFPKALEEIINDIKDSNITINGVDSRWNSFLDEFILGSYPLDQYSLFASYFFIYKYKKGF
jgi:hypothetical protein